MTLASRLTELRKKHAILSQKIEEEQRHPAFDDLLVTALKRQKLQLKEEIERISHQT